VCHVVDFLDTSDPDIFYAALSCADCSRVVQRRSFQINGRNVQVFDQICVVFSGSLYFSAPLLYHTNVVLNGRCYVTKQATQCLSCVVVFDAVGFVPHYVAWLRHR